jgi:hypothetical protein
LTPASEKGKQQTCASLLLIFYRRAELATDALGDRRLFGKRHAGNGPRLQVHQHYRRHYMGTASMTLS